MSLTNAPEPEARARVVKQDLDAVLHPLVQRFHETAHIHGSI
jgi:hypothetical protein